MASWLAANAANWVRKVCKCLVRWSGVIDLELVAGGGGSGGQVAGVGVDDEAAESAFDDAGVDDVGGAGAPGVVCGDTGLDLVERAQPGIRPARDRRAWRAVPRPPWP